MSEERKRRAVFTRRQLATMLIATMHAVSNNSRQIEKRIDAAEVKLLDLLGARMDLEAGLQYEDSDAALAKKVEAEFSELEIFGIKIGLVQKINGAPPFREPAAHGYKKYQIMPIARELGIEAQVRKETEAQDQKNDLTLEFDAMPEAEAKEEAPGQGDKAVSLG